jgi:tetratricopeptide (TPR) repeat protein
VVDHPARACLAEIVVSRTGSQPVRGSGYLVAPGWVLTACHLVDGAGLIGVWLGAPAELRQADGVGVDPQSVLMVPGADVALLPVGMARSNPSCEPALFGRLDRDSPTSAPVVAAGFPRFKLRPSPIQPAVMLRELHYATGTIMGGSNVKTATHEFAVHVVPAQDPDPRTHSPWEGMSGAAVWATGRLVGVVGQHHRGEGLGSLSVRPLEELFSHASAACLADWRAVLPQLPVTSDKLWVSTPPAARRIEVARARRAVEALAPVVLIGRSAELVTLNEFVASGIRWRWVQGDAFAGKTALLAWFALHPPDRVAVVACFLRRTTGENSADYALDVLTRQLALLADRRDYRPVQFLSERANDLIDLLDEAAHVCAERGQRLVVLIDGLDEYEPATPGLGLAAWLPDASELPESAVLVVSSRTGVDIDLPCVHPLRTHMHYIAASDAASEIQHAARAELDQALKSPGGFVFPLVCALAIADGGLTAGELCALLQRRGRDVDVSEVEAVLGSRLARSLARVADPDGVDGQVYVFGHDSLLAEACARFAADLATYEDLLDGWAREYAWRGWPADTPRYLLRPYTRQLTRRARDPAIPEARCRGAVDQLFAVAAHRSRWLRLFERTGNPAVANEELVAAQQTLLNSRDRIGLEPDEVVFRLAALALRRQPLTGIKADIAATIAAVWARIGRLDASFALAGGVDDRRRRAEALSGVAKALVAAGQVEQAANAADSIDDPQRRVEALSGVAQALANAGQVEQAACVAEQALQVAVSIDAPWRRTIALSAVAQALANAGQVEQAACVAEQALQVAVSIDAPWWRTIALSAWRRRWPGPARSSRRCGWPLASKTRTRGLMR